MRYLYAPIVGFIVLLLNLITPVLVLFTLPFIKWDKEPSMPARNCLPIPVMGIQGSLPKWLSWFETPDQRLPGDLTIVEVKHIYDKYGRTFCSWYWMGWRNMLMGLSCWLGKDVSGQVLDGTDNFIEAEGVWRYTVHLGKVRLITGYEIYELRDIGKFRAAPYVTAKIS